MKEEEMPHFLTAGEYVRYKGELVKIGAQHNLYFTPFQKYVAALRAGQLKRDVGFRHPNEYAQPDAGFRFRFPFPGEKHLPLGKTGALGFFSGVPINVDISSIRELNERFGPNYYPNTLIALEIVQQELITGSNGRPMLALVLRNNDMGCLVRMEDKLSIDQLVRQIYRRHVMDELDKGKRALYRGVSLEILKGYQIKMAAPDLVNKVRDNRSRRRGLWI